MVGRHFKTLFLLLYLCCYHQAKAEPLKSVEVPENCYIITPKRFSTLDHDPPNCTIQVQSNFPLENITCPEKGVMRIIGEYTAIHINCTASFPLDFNFNGVMPTEAIEVNLRRTVIRNTNRQNISYHSDLKIYSVAALSDHYNTTATENSKASAYSRTGNYIFSGYHDLSYIFTSIYIFFEEPSVTSNFIRNQDIFLKMDGNTLRVPCRTTHYHTNVTLLQNGMKKVAPYSPTNGFTIADVVGMVFDDSHSCSLRQNGIEVVIVVPNVRPVTTLAPPPGNSGRGTPTITANLQPMSFGSYGTKISCRISNMDSYGDSALLTAIGAANAPMHRLTRDFTLPNFVNRSYSVLVGKRENDFKNHLKIRTLIPDHVISAVCGNHTIRSSMSFGTTISCEIFPFTFEQEWSLLDRDQSNADRYFLLGNNDDNNEFYENQEVTFKCRISAFIMTPPAIWYVKYRNGTLQEEFIDNDWPNGISHFTKNVTHETERVICSASIWFKDEWWNISAPIKIRYSEAPYFDEEACTKSEETFTLNTKRLIRCKANGSPPPGVYWQRNGKDITNVSTGESIFQFKKIKQSDEGEYICVAVNYLGQKSWKLLLDVDSGSDNPSIYIGAASATVVALCIALTIYIHFFKKKKGGLSKAEITEFMEGKVSSSYETPSDIYKALTGVIPYDEQFEISQNRFQIDKTYILGSGAYGIVYKGLLDGKPVAVKTVKEHADTSYLKSLLAELKVMIYLEDHGNLVKLLGAYTKKLYKGKVYVFVDYCPLGCLEKFLRTNRGTACLEEAPIYSKIGLVTNTQSTITVKDLYNWSIQIAQGMAYLSNKKVIHGDLAARNVLLTESRVAKITDFGLSRRLYDYAEYVRKKEERLPWRWLALESLKELSFSTRSDIWSYGVTLWEIFSLAETPYSGVVFGIPFVTQIENGVRLPPPQFASPELYNAVMMACWNGSPDLRPSFTEISKILRHLSTTVKSPTTYLPNNILYTRVSSNLNT